MPLASISQSVDAPFDILGTGDLTSTNQCATFSTQFGTVVGAERGRLDSSISGSGSLFRLATAVADWMGRVVRTLISKDSLSGFWLGGEQCLSESKGFGTFTDGTFCLRIFRGTDGDALGG